MSENKVVALCLGIVALALIFGLAVTVLAAYLLYIFIGIGVLIVITGAAFAVRKWQHSGLPIHEAKRETQRLEYAHQQEMARIALEQDRHRHQAELERERQAHELELQARWARVSEHLALTRIPYDPNGNAPALLDHADRHITMLPAGQPPYRPTKEQIAAPVQPLLGPGEPQVPRPYDLLAEFGTFRPTRNEVFLARSAEGPILVPLSKLWHIIFTGPTGGGKTSILRMLLMQLLYLQCQVTLGDIHFAPIKKTEDGQLIDWRPIEKRLARPPIRSAEEIYEWMKWLAYEELQARIDRQYAGQPVGTPYFFTIEELPAVLDECPDLAQPLAKILRQGRQYFILFLGASQDLLTSTLKMSSGPRECFRTGYYTGGDPHTAKALLDLRNGEKIDEDGLGVQGLVYLKTAIHPAMQVRAPWASNEALYTLLNVPVEERLSSGASRADAQPHTERINDRFEDDRAAHIIEADTPENEASEELPGNVPAFPQNGMNAPGAQPDATTEERPKEYQLNEQEIALFIVAYKSCGNIDKALSLIGRGGWYKKHASAIVKAHNLRKDA